MLRPLLPGWSRDWCRNRRGCGPGLVHGDPHGQKYRRILHQLPAPLRIAPLPQQPAAQVVTACDVVELDAGFVQLGQDPQLVPTPPPPAPLNPISAVCDPAPGRRTWQPSGTWRRTSCEGQRTSTA